MNNLPIKNAGPLVNSYAPESETVIGLKEQPRDKDTEWLQYENRVTEYVKDCKARIKKHWVIKPAAVYLRIDTKFRIYRDGVIADERIFKSCGTKYYDDLAIKAIRLASPLPKLPDGAPEFFDIDFVFELSPTRKLEETTKHQNLAPPRRKPTRDGIIER